MACAPSKDLRSDWHLPSLIRIFTVHIHPVWSASLLSTWINLESLASNWACSKAYDQTRLIHRLIWVFPGSTYCLVGFVICWLLLYVRQSWNFIDGKWFRSSFIWVYTVCSDMFIVLPFLIAYLFCFHFRQRSSLSTWHTARTNLTQIRCWLIMRELSLK